MSATTPREPETPQTEAGRRLVAVYGVGQFGRTEAMVRAIEDEMEARLSPPPVAAVAEDRAAPPDDFHAALLRNDAAHYLAMALADRGIVHEDKSLVDTIPILRVLDEYGFAIVLRSSLPEGHWAKADPSRARRFGEPSDE